MAWSDVAPRLVSIVEGAVPAVTTQGTRASFRDVPEASEDAPPRTRDFTFAVNGGSTVGGLIEAGGRRAMADVTLMVFYDDRRNAADLRDAMLSDYSAIRDRLLDQTLWERGTSGIESIALFGGDIVLTFEIETVDGGAVLLVDFPVRYVV